jgi:3-phenylpropionate/cinnamic acid dioxygenase small subunit
MTASTVAEATPTTTRVPVGSPIYNEVLEFLYDEARMLDEIRLQDWGATLAEDLLYRPRR